MKEKFINKCTLSLHHSVDNEVLTLRLSRKRYFTEEKKVCRGIRIHLNLG